MGSKKRKTQFVKFRISNSDLEIVRSIYEKESSKTGLSFSAYIRKKLLQVDEVETENFSKNDLGKIFESLQKIKIIFEDIELANEKFPLLPESVILEEYKRLLESLNLKSREIQKELEEVDYGDFKIDEH